MRVRNSGQSSACAKLFRSDLAARISAARTDAKAFANLRFAFLEQHGQTRKGVAQIRAVRPHVLHSSFTAQIEESAVIPVIFLHGIGGGGRSFAPQIASFASAGYQPVALDLPGYGTREPVDAMSFEALAADVEFTLAQSGLDQPVLVGHSMGGMLVQTLLRRKPDGYAAAVLSCTSPAFGSPAGDFQKKFVADRLAPLDEDYSMATIAPEAADNRWGRTPIRPAARCSSRNYAADARSDLSRSRYNAS